MKVRGTTYTTMILKHTGTANLGRCGTVNPKVNRAKIQMRVTV